MTAIAGVAGSRPLSWLERACRDAIDAQSLYGQRSPQFAAAPGACLGASLYDRTPEETGDRQPLANDRFLLVTDARLDNRDELITALGLREAGADSDILFAGWTRWDCDLFDRIVGPFALAVYDIRQQRLILARSPQSDRPLCFRLGEGELRFASMPSGLIETPASPNLPGLARYLLEGDKAQSETFFADVNAVPPGHFLEWTAGQHRMTRWWRPAGADGASRPRAVEEFRHLLAESVGSRLRRLSGPVGTQLSGGFDSGSVTATAAGLLADRTNLIAYTMAPAPELPWSIPRNYVVDESALASETARMLGIRHDVVSHRGPLFDCLAGHARIYQEPVHNVINFGWSHEIDQAASAEGVKVLLIGEKGNASISYGNIHLLSDWLRHGRLLDYWTQVRALVTNGSARWRGALFYSIRDFLPERLADALAGDTAQSPADVFLRPEWVKPSREVSVGANYQSDGLRQDQFYMYANNDLGVHKKANLARHGIDERDPTADRRLIEFALRLPAEEFLKGGMTRRLARCALADRLPASVVNNRLRGYQGADWHAKFDIGQARGWLEEIGASSTAAQILDLDGLRRALDGAGEAATLPPLALRDWGYRVCRAIAVGAFIREIERDDGAIGRRP